MKILWSSFFLCPNRYSDMKCLNENHAADYNLDISLFNPSFIGFKMLRRVQIISSLLMPVNYAQFQRTVELSFIKTFGTWHKLAIFFWYHNASLSHSDFLHLFSFSNAASGIILIFLINLIPFLVIVTRCIVFKYIYLFPKKLP